MEIYVNYLAIEVTRRCNMKCNHCLRGDAQNLDISTAVLSGIAKHKYQRLPGFCTQLLLNAERRSKK